MHSSRAVGMPLAMPAEVVRADVLERLANRWRVPVTLVVGGAGFGKSTVLAQAIRANALEPCGLDVWHSCGPGDENADVLGRALLTALGGTGQQPDLVSQLVDALTSHSPLDVCLVLDDAHEVRPGSSSAEMLTSLVRRLPGNAHLVVASRHDPAIALSKRRAAHEVVEITDQHLLFTNEESALFATRLGRDPASVAALGGWPALVRLALSVRPDFAVSYAREEVLEGLTSAQRRTLFVLSNLGLSDEARVAEVLRGPVDLSSLAAAVPMITTTEDGRFRAHDLWRDAVLRTLDREESTALRSRVIDSLIADTQLARAGQLAVAYRDIEPLLQVAEEMVRRTISVLPVDTVLPWNEVLQQARPEAPETQLLGAAIAHSLNFADTEVDSSVDGAFDGFRRADDVNGQMAALAVGTVAAHSRGDLQRLVELAATAQQCPNLEEHPVANMAVHSVAAVVAEMSGDVETALYELRAAHLERVPPGVGMAAQRFLFHCLLVNGDADEAAAVADRMVAVADSSMVRYLPTFARWMAGNPHELLRLGGPPEHEPGTSSRDQFVRHTMIGFVWSCLGRIDEVDAILNSRELSEHQRLAVSNHRDDTLMAVLRALGAVLKHDDDLAARHIEEVLSQCADSRMVEQHLRRFLPIAYVLNRHMRERWDSADLGPSHCISRSVARLLSALRAGRPPGNVSALEPSHVLTSLPLPWSIELACRLHATGQSRGVLVADWLVAHTAGRALEELRHLAEGAAHDEPIRNAAADLLRRLPATPTQHTTVSVLGPLAVAIDLVAAPSAQMRRARVRTLLALLVVHHTITRERAIDLLWPELGPVEGARNLRVTLTYLRQLVEPHRNAGEAAFHVRADAATITLHASDSLTVDLWELERLAEEAHACRARGDIESTMARFAEATSLWRGDPLIDLSAVVDQESAVERARLVQCRSLLELGELRLTHGLAAEATIDAERALVLDPYLERAHRLALAAALLARNHSALAAMARRAAGVFDEFGAEPEPATQILLQQAESLSGAAHR